jgi:hypothetical protein
MITLRFGGFFEHDLCSKFEQPISDLSSSSPASITASQLRKVSVRSALCPRTDLESLGPRFCKSFRVIHSVTEAVKQLEYKIDCAADVQLR